MKAVLIGIAPVVVTCALCAVALGLWVGCGASLDIRARVPGTDRAPGVGPVQEGPFIARHQLVKGDGVPADSFSAWPRFRGDNGDGVSSENVPLARTWPPGGPKVLWSVEMGEGHAGAAVWNGRVYVLDYDRQKKADVLRCLSLTDGKDIWRHSYPVDVKRNHGMSRTVPAVTDKAVVALGPKCHVTCFDPKTGDLKWGLDLVKDFGAKVPPWYAGQCPLIDGDRVILAPGGPDVLVMAVDAETGKPAWRTPNPQDWAMTHSSIIPMEFMNKRMYVYCASGGVVGVSAEDGRVLWQTDAWKISIATVPSPVVVGDGRLFLSGGYNAGSLVLALKEEGSGFVAEPTLRLPAKVFGAAQQTPVFYNGCLYGVRPDGELVCLDLAGKTVWASGPERRFGLGPFLVAGGLLYALNDSGLLTAAEATPEGFKPLAGPAQVLTGHDAWGPMAIADGKLIARDLTRMVCLDVSAK
jgi:outer membrane protein assembly factor BamB